MREPKARVGFRAGDAEASVWERVSGESGRPFEPCQMPGLTGVRSHHSLFGLLGFRGPTDDLADVDAISKLASEPSSSPFHPSSLDSEPFSLPAEYTAKAWEVELLGNVEVREVSIAESIDELAEV